MSNQHDDADADQNPAWVTPVGIAIVALALIAIVLVQTMAPSSDDPAQGSGGSDMDLTEFERRDPDDLLATGPVDAPVDLIVYSDYQCPFCAAWNHDTLPVMMEYVETGDLRIEWRDVNVFGEASERAARAAYAAALQDRFWEYHDELFAGGEHLPASQLTDEALVDLAGRLGLDSQQFATDMNSDQTLRETERNEQEAADLGVSGTPTYVLGGRLLVGALPTSDFVDTLHEALGTKAR